MKPLKSTILVLSLSMMSAGAEAQQGARTGLPGGGGPPPSAMLPPREAGPPPGAMMGPREPSRPAQQTGFSVHLDGVSAVQLAWWFQHLADEDGRYWKPLAPHINQSISWVVNPREDAHHIIGAMFASDQAVAGMPGGKLHLQAQFQDFITQPRSFIPGQPFPITPPLSLPRDYRPAYPSPLAVPFGGPPRPSANSANGFNQQLLLTDGHGFAPGRMLWSWQNSGGDDTLATAGQPVGIDLTVTLYQPWMEGANRPPALSLDGYYWTPRQVRAVWSAWAAAITALPANLPGWFNADTQDDVARTKGYTVSGEIDTGFVEGVDSRMMVWWWNHAMGDAPGTAYSLWAPSAHFAIRWLPGYSPSDVLQGAPVPTDRVVPGAIYPDLQGGNLMQDGGGMMSYPPAMAPISGKYKVIDPMFPVRVEQVANFPRDRFPQPRAWLLHQWEDRPGGMIHRSTTLARLPLMTPITEQGYYAEHQMMEGQFWGHSQGMRKAYAAFLAGSGK